MRDDVGQAKPSPVTADLTVITLLFIVFSAIGWVVWCMAVRLDGWRSLFEPCTTVSRTSAFVVT